MLRRRSKNTPAPPAEPQAPRPAFAWPERRPPTIVPERRQPTVFSERQPTPRPEPADVAPTAQRDLWDDLDRLTEELVGELDSGLGPGSPPS